MLLGHGGVALIESGLFREVGIAGIGAVGTWWSGLNREWSLREVGIAGRCCWDMVEWP